MSHWNFLWKYLNSKCSIFLFFIFKVFSTEKPTIDLFKDWIGQLRIANWKVCINIFLFYLYIKSVTLFSEGENIKRILFIYLNKSSLLFLKNKKRWGYLLLILIRLQKKKKKRIRALRTKSTTPKGCKLIFIKGIYIIKKIILIIKFFHKSNIFIVKILISIIKSSLWKKSI